MTITSFPAPCQIRWNAKSKDDDTFTPIDINADEYNGTTVTFPHPMLVVRQRDQLENNCYQIEVTNFVGKIVQTISGRKQYYPSNSYIKRSSIHHPLQNSWISENLICITEVAGIYIDAYGQIEAILLCFYCSSINTNVKWNNGEE